MIMVDASMFIVFQGALFFISGSCLLVALVAKISEYRMGSAAADLATRKA